MSTRVIDFLEQAEEAGEYKNYHLIKDTEPYQGQIDVFALALIARISKDHLKKKALINNSDGYAFWLNIDPEDLSSATDEELLTLARCGLGITREFGNSPELELRCNGYRGKSYE